MGSGAVTPTCAAETPGGHLQSPEGSHSREATTVSAHMPGLALNMCHWPTPVTAAGMSVTPVTTGGETHEQSWQYPEPDAHLRPAYVTASGLPKVEMPTSLGGGKDLSGMPVELSDGLQHRHGGKGASKVVDQARRAADVVRGLVQVCKAASVSTQANSAVEPSFIGPTCSSAVSSRRHTAGSSQRQGAEEPVGQGSASNGTGGRQNGTKPPSGRVRGGARRSSGSGSWSRSTVDDRENQSAMSNEASESDKREQADSGSNSSDGSQRSSSSTGSQPGWVDGAIEEEDLPAVEDGPFSKLRAILALS